MFFFGHQQDGFYYTVDFYLVNHSSTEHDPKVILEDLLDVSVSIQTGMKILSLSALHSPQHISPTGLML